MTPANFDVRFTPNSGLKADIQLCPFGAKTRQSALQQEVAMNSPRGHQRGWRAISLAKP